jgi:site-specific recombinase XerD
MPGELVVASGETSDLAPITDLRSPISESASRYARAEKADATRRAYAKDFQSFVAWRVACACVPAATFPASAGEVADYLAHCADCGLTVSTIQRRAAAIAHAHKQLGFEPPTASDRVKAVLRGIRRTCGVGARSAKAAATADIVLKMVKRIPDTLAGRRDRALILLGFAAALRRSELVGLDVGAIGRVDAGVIVGLGKSKTDQEGRGAEVPVPHGFKLKTIEALDAWLCAGCLSEGPLFRRIGKGGRLLPGRLTDQSVALIIKKWALRAGLDPKLFSGHSLRAGFVTSALQAKADLFKVMDVTRHRSVDTLRKYDRRAKAFVDHAGKRFL